MDLDAWLAEQIGQQTIVNTCYCAFFYDELDEYLERIEVLDEALRRTPSSLVALNNRGMMFFEIGEVDKSLVDLKLACELATLTALPHQNLGSIYEHMGAFENAKECFERAIFIDPSSSSAKASLMNMKRHQD